MTKLSKKQILSLSEKERNEYFSAQLAELKDVEKTIKKELARKESAIMAKNRSKINHAKYLLAGYVLSEAKKANDFSALENCLATLTAERDIRDMNALMASLTLPGAAESSWPVSPTSSPQQRKANPQKS